MKTMLELVATLRTSFLHDLGGYGFDWTSFEADDKEAVNLRWSNEELVAHITEAVRQVYRRINPVVKYEPAFDIAVVAGTAEYALSAKILDLHGVRLLNAKTDLEPIDHQDLWRSRNNWEEDEGKPQAYLHDYAADRIRLVPIPVEADTLKLYVSRLPLVEPTWTTNHLLVELRDEWCYSMLYWAAYLCYLKDETATYDPNKAANYKALFDQAFTQTDAYSEMRKRRTNNRPIKYGGIALRGNTWFRNRRRFYGSI